MIEQVEMVLDRKQEEPTQESITLNRQERVIFDIIKRHQPIITALLIKYGIEEYIGCPDKIARNLRKKGLINSRDVKDKNYVEWFVVGGYVILMPLRQHGIAQVRSLGVCSKIDRVNRGFVYEKGESYEKKEEKVNI